MLGPCFANMPYSSRRLPAGGLAQQGANVFNKLFGRPLLRRCQEHTLGAARRRAAPGPAAGVVAAGAPREGAQPMRRHSARTLPRSTGCS